MTARFVHVTSISAVVLWIVVLLSCRTVLAEGPLFLGFEKIAVFPIQWAPSQGSSTPAAAFGTVDEATTKSLDEVWWQVREELTSTGRFVVASRAFLQRVDAFQPRGALSTADAVILSRHVEAEALVTVQLQGRTLTISAWEGAEGSKLWNESVELHPSVLVRDQIGAVAKGLIRNFIAHLPYHGVTLIDPLTRTPVYVDGGKKLVRVKVGTDSRIADGDTAQWIRVRRSSLDPLLIGGSKSEVVAVGHVVSVKDQTAVIELSSTVESAGLSAGTLVNFPAEAARLTQGHGDEHNDRQKVAELANQILKPVEHVSTIESRKETRPLATTLSLLASLAGLLLLAF